MQAAVEPDLLVKGPRFPPLRSADQKTETRSHLDSLSSVTSSRLSPHITQSPIHHSSPITLPAGSGCGTIVFCCSHALERLLLSRPWNGRDRDRRLQESHPTQAHRRRRPRTRQSHNQIETTDHTTTLLVTTCNSRGVD